MELVAGGGKYRFPTPRPRPHRPDHPHPEQAIAGALAHARPVLHR